MEHYQWYKKHYCSYQNLCSRLSYRALLRGIKIYVSKLHVEHYQRYNCICFNFQRNETHIPFLYDVSDPYHMLPQYSICAVKRKESIWVNVRLSGRMNTPVHFHCLNKNSKHAKSRSYLCDTFNYTIISISPLVTAWQLLKPWILCNPVRCPYVTQPAIT